MKKKYIASILSEGNQIFQPSITVADEGLSLRFPGRFKNKEEFFRYEDISGFSIKEPRRFAPLYCTVSLNARGTWVEAHGFTKSDARKIKRYIEDGQKGNKGGNISNSSRSRELETYEEWRVRSRKDWNDWLTAVGKFAEEQREEILEFMEKIKKALTQSLKYFYLFSDLNEKKKVDELQGEIVNFKKMLLKYLKRIGEESQYETIIEECRQSARADTDEKIEHRRQATIDMIDRIVHESFQADEEKETKFDFKLPTFNADKGNEDDLNENRNQIENLTKAYDDLDVEILEDCEKVNQNSLLVETMIKNLIKGEQGRMYLRKEIQFIDFENLKHAQLVEKLFNIINNIYDSIAYQQSKDGTKVFPFGLDNPKIVDYLKNEGNSVCDKISKLIDVTDSFVDRIAKSIE